MSSSDVNNVHEIMYFLEFVVGYNHENSRKWIYSPNRRLSGYTPEEMLRIDPDSVREQLCRIEHRLI